jgi:hypothetical protein
MAQAFKVTFAGEPHTVVSTAGDIVRLYQWAGGDPDGNNAAVHGYLIWLAVKRTGLFDGDFEAFLDVLEDFEAAEVPKAPSKKRSPSSSL